MLNTGYISFITESGGGQDANGNPVPSTKVNSSYLKCNINTLTKEYRLLIDGQYKEARFSVIIDDFEIGAIDLTGLKEINLQDSNSVDLGTFQVQNKESLSFVKRLLIVV